MDVQGMVSKTLIIAPHMDDEAISCAGLIQDRIAAGRQVFVQVMHGRAYDYGQEGEDKSYDEELKDFLVAKGLLKYTQHNCMPNLREGEPTKVGYYKMLKHIESQIAGLKPDEVVGPAYDDLNQDHRFLHHVLGIALRPINLGRVVRSLEFFALDGSVKQPTYFVPLTEMQMHVKLSAIAAYRRESRTGTSPRSPENVLAQARVWGAACGSTFAEAYRIRFAREANAGRNNGVERVHRDEPVEVSGAS